MSPVTQKEGSTPEPNQADTTISDFPASRFMENNFVIYSAIAAQKDWVTILLLFKTFCVKSEYTEWSLCFTSVEVDL